MEFDIGQLREEIRDFVAWDKEIDKQISETEKKTAYSEGFIDGLREAFKILERGER